MTQIKPNRRAHKTINKTYRFFKTDIWGYLGKKLRDRKITRIVAAQARADLKTDLRNFPRNLVKRIKKFFYRSRSKKKKKNYAPNNRNMLYQLTKTPKQKKLRQRALHNTLLKLRKKLSLFYGGGKIRAKTFRRFTKLVIEQGRSKICKTSKSIFQQLINYFDYTKFLESRLDVLILRANFLSTIFTIRQAIVHRKTKVLGQKRIDHPGFLVKSYRIFRISLAYCRYMGDFLTRLQKISFFRIKPAYLWANIGLLFAFKIREPISKKVSYPFRSPINVHLIFKGAFLKH